ncbi:MAG: citramalate synthase [Candidatus Ancillula sp.]|jgi:2-isopropylmalate synthase|nr:citramalate synthase [Candidatus Ancillula sp.]
MRKIEIYDTTLRDGAQQQGVNFSIADKMNIATMLHDFGIELIEGGWPGAIPKDTEFFSKAKSQLPNVSLIAFGATRKPGMKASDDPQVRALIDSEASRICVVAKSDVWHVEKGLQTTMDENLEMVCDTVRQIMHNGAQPIVDAEHFFDGVTHNQDYAFSVVLAAFNAGANCVVLCDTNGGSLPEDVSRVVRDLFIYLEANGVPISNDAHGERYLGIHAHNDTGCAVANSVAAVQAGVAHVQGTINEYGERTGNANLLTVIANLELKLGIKTVPDLSKSFNLAHNIAEIANINLNVRQPYVGDIAFAHKAGLHASAIKVDPDLYQHIAPSLVGNDLKMIVSEMAGRSSITLKADELGFNLGEHPEIITELTSKVKDLEASGYAFDSADASFELLLREVLGKKHSFFKVESWRTISERQGPRGSEAVSEATVKLQAGGKRVIATGEGNGPVNALDAALREAISDVYPRIADMELTDYRVRLLDTSHGTDSITRVLITCYDKVRNHSWTTTGVGGNIVESSWEALTDCYIYGLIKAEVVPNV